MRAPVKICTSQISVFLLVEMCFLSTSPLKILHWQSQEQRGFTMKNCLAQAFLPSLTSSRVDVPVLSFSQVKGRLFTEYFGYAPRGSFWRERTVGQVSLTWRHRYTEGVGFEALNDGKFMLYPMYSHMKWKEMSGRSNENLQICNL